MSRSLSCRVTTHKDDGAIIEDVVLRQERGCYGVDIPKNVWHKLESLESGSGRKRAPSILKGGSVWTAGAGQRTSSG